MSRPADAAYSFRMQVELGAAKHGVGRIPAEIEDAGGELTALEVARRADGGSVVSCTVNATGDAHARAIGAAVDRVPHTFVRAIDDQTFLMHHGGKVEVRSKVPLENHDQLSIAYTPGVARVCRAIHSHPAEVWRLTIKKNAVAVVTDGSAVLGLGNIGAEAALPVMEGKAALFKQFGDVDAWPVCLDTQDVDEIVRTVKLIAPSYGGINLEDIAAPACFEIEQRLRADLDIPVFHDDQHGTAIVIMAAIFNALKVVRKDLTDVKVTMVGAGAAGVATAKMLRAEGVGRITMCDRLGIISSDRPDLSPTKRWIADHVTPTGSTGTILDALTDADVFIGVSGPDLLVPDDLARMAPDSIVFALANPDPEVDPRGARAHAAVVATGRSDEPNQINNVLAFPGVFRGALDAHAAEITESMKLAAARAIAGCVAESELRPDYIVPSVFNGAVAPAVAAAVRRAAEG